MQKRYIVSAMMGLWLLGSAGCTHMASPREEVLKGNQGQVVVVSGKSESLRAKLELYEGSQLVFGPVAAVVGRAGIAQVGQKREGDGKTPQGLFNIESAFGYEDEVVTKLRYDKMTSQDKWIDDVNSPNYNQWIRGSTKAKSFEHLKRADDIYKYAFVIGYNRSPILRGHGSAIFAHVWQSSESGTAGCVAIEEPHMKKLLTLLDQSKAPRILIVAE